VAPDGGAAVINEVSPTTRNDILVLPLSSGAKPWPFLQTPAEEWGGRISPDGRWLAYSVNEVGPGRDEVYVRAFPGPGERHPISTNGGLGAAWSASGRELFYRERNRMMVVDVKTAPSFTASIPRPLFDLKGRFREEFDVTPDGQRFILVHELEDEPPTEIRVGFGLLLPRRGSPQP
jgi:serine/threonine-protein kinase